MPRSGWFVSSQPATTTLRRSTPAARIARWLRTGGFRQVELNIAGWSAVLAPGAAVGLVGGIFLDRDLPFGIPVGMLVGAVCSWLVALSIDRLRWRRSEGGYDITDLSPRATDDLTARLIGDGIQFRVTVEADEPTQPRRILHAQMRWRREVDVCLDEARAMESEETPDPPWL